MTEISLPIIPPDRSDDLHGLEFAETADLVLFMAGNQFMVMNEIVSAFQAQYPEIKKIFNDPDLRKPTYRLQTCAIFI